MGKNLEELRQLNREYLTCADVAPCLGADQHTLHVAAVSAPNRLGFPVIVVGNRVKIPRRAFLRFMEGGGTG